MKEREKIPDDLPTDVCRNLVDIIRFRAREQPQERIFTFLGDGVHESESLTFGELDRRAENLAAALQRWGGRGERVLLCYPSGLEFIIAFFGCLYAGAVAVPTMPPQGRQGLAALGPIAADAEPKVILTIPSQRDAIRERLGSAVATIACLQEVDRDTTPGFEPRVAGADLAMLQYTSGSTGAPKGVMLSHASLVHNQGIIFRQFGHHSSSVVVSWLPMFHDMGLIGCVMQPLYMGRPCVLLSPTHFLQEPVRWLRAITHYGATTSGAPNFAYDLCVDRVAADELDNLDLKTWEVAFNGSEPIRATTLERFTERYSACGFRPDTHFPCFGMAEASLFVTGGPKRRPPRVRHFDGPSLERHRVRPVASGTADARTLVGCGSLPDDQRILIVDPETTHILPGGAVGEIWISGPSVAQGYWRKPETSRATFCTHGNAEGRYLRTGDLGFVEDGELFITGRRDDLLIVRGKNHYPQDLEYTAEKSHPALRPNGAAAFAVESAKGNHLVLVLEVRRNLGWSVDPREVANAVRAAVSREHGLYVAMVALVAQGAVPKTSSGKVKRRACRRAFERGELKLIEPGSRPGHRDALDSSSGKPHRQPSGCVTRTG